VNAASRLKHVVIVGGGFAGLACARKLASSDDVHVTLLDKNNFHQFQPLLYQVATAQLGSNDIATSLRKSLRGHANVDVKMEEVIAANPKQVEQYRAGKKTIAGFFVGQVMKASKGQANPALLNELVARKLDS